MVEGEFLTTAGADACGDYGAEMSDAPTVRRRRPAVAGHSVVFALVTYLAARKALAEARRVDDVKNIRDRAMALQEYARQAKDGDMIARATDIRLRAERRAGQLLGEMKDCGEREAGGRPEKHSRGARVNLSDLGVTRMQSSRWQKLGALDDAAFEARADVTRRRAVSSVESTS